MAVKPYHLVPTDSTRTLCGDYDVTGWRVVDVPWGGLLRLQAVPRRTRGRERLIAEALDLVEHGSDLMLLI